MKILMVSMASLHFFRWTEQLQDSGHEVYWFDILDGGEKVERISWVRQKVNWKRKWNYPGRFFIKKRVPKLYHFLQKFNERNTAKVFERYVKEIKPDVVHSFVIHIGCLPITPVMEKYKDLDWLLSTWGSDIYARKNNERGLKIIKNILPKIKYLFTDCKRDYNLAVKMGFSGKFLGNYPGGGGYDLKTLGLYKQKLKNTILIKGKEDKHGRCINVLKALNDFKDLFLSYQIIVFGANSKVMQFYENSSLNNWPNITIHKTISQEKLFQLMGASKIYIGNSLSDGLPNTLLEAIIMGVFPIQSNPGGATAELITHGKNGFLIQNPEESLEIAGLLKQAIENPKFLEEAVLHNSKHITPSLERVWIQKQVIEAYHQIETDLNNKL